MFLFHLCCRENSPGVAGVLCTDSQGLMLGGKVTEAQ